MDAGELVPDEVIVGMITERVGERDARDGFLLDGFPRNAEQADALAEALDGLERRLTAALLIEVPDEEVVRRLAGRRVCVKNPSHIYHVDFDPPKHEGVCDQDGSRLIQRDDDKEETIRRRLEVYHAQTEPLIALLRRARAAAPLRRHARARRGARPHPRDGRDAAPGGEALVSGAAAKLALGDHQEVARGDREDGARRRDPRRRRSICCEAHDPPGRQHRRSSTSSPSASSARSGAVPTFKGYRGFPGSICASPNAMIVHGIPGPYRLKARRHHLDRRRRDARRLGRRRGAHVPGRRDRRAQAATC